MPTKTCNVIARTSEATTKQHLHSVAPYARTGVRTVQVSPRLLLLLVTLFTLLLASCGTQAAAAPLPQITQESIPITASIQIVTSTPVAKFVGDAVPPA